MKYLLTSVLRLVLFFSNRNILDICVVDILLSDKIRGIKPVYIDENGRYVYDENNNMIL